MTDTLAPLAVVGKGDGTVGAGQRFTALPADQYCGKTTPVEEHQGLLANRQVLLQCLKKDR
jgi:hypothetical protein